MLRFLKLLYINRKYKTEKDKTSIYHYYKKMNVNVDDKFKKIKLGWVHKYYDVDDIYQIKDSRFSRCVNTRDEILKFIYNDYNIFLRKEKIDKIKRKIK